ncbi:hypothetical protein ACJRPK_14010 [Aquimarina sp. 2-A2]|uniref:hypothetical protein n=1 Tax=Aquimarina sp. 2-A2 TaxID=3382644 RepID=UPI00387F0193
MKDPNKIAEQLISDFIEMQPKYLDKIGIPMNRQYEFAKCQAKYCAHVAKFSHAKESDDFEYWFDVQKAIEKL